MADTPVEVKALKTNGDRIYVLDGRLRQLRSYDTTGKLLFAVGKWGKEEKELDTPLGLSVYGDTIMILDLSHYDHVTLYSLDGQYLAARMFPMEEGATSFEISPGRMVFTTLWGRRQNNVLYTMLGTDERGRVRWLGCQADPQYEESDRRRGMAGKYAFRSVARAADRLFCIQPLSPVVQMYDSLGNFAGVLRRAPTFYRPPTHQPESQNIKEMQFFESQWTAHTAIFPYPGGMVSVYSTWDSDKGGLSYLLFACDSGTTPMSKLRCGIATSPGQPVGLLGADTLLVVVRDGEEKPLKLSRFLARISQ